MFILTINIRFTFLSIDWPTITKTQIEMLTNIPEVLETNNHTIGITKNVQRTNPDLFEGLRFLSLTNDINWLI